jgi:hypothetical protein
MKYDHNKNEIISPTAEIPITISTTAMGLYNRNGNIDTSTDAFGRNRISQPYTMFDSNFKYSDSTEKWSTSNTGNSSSSFLANAACMLLSVSANSGDKVYRETKRVFPYQPGKSLLNLTTFVMNSPKDNLCQRVGYFSTKNGIFLEQANNTINIVKRSYADGSVKEVRIPQSDWNVNKLQGSDKNLGSIVLDLSHSQIFWSDIEWLGVGSVRTGFVINGQYIPCHIFHHANYETDVYMTTSSLPIRYEIENVGVTTSSSNLKQICSTVISEGGYDVKAIQGTVTRTIGIASNAAATGYSPVVSIRLAPNREDAIILADAVNLVGDGNNAIYEWALIKNANIVGGDWTLHYANNIQYNSNATSMTGGIVLNSGIFTSSRQASQVVDSSLEYNFSFQLGRDQTPTSDTITVGVRHLAVGGTVYGSLGWKDLTQ